MILTIRSYENDSLLTENQPEVDSPERARSLYPYDLVEDRLNVLYVAHKYDRYWNQHAGAPETFDLNLAEADRSAGYAFQSGEQRAILKRRAQFDLARFGHGQPAGTELIDQQRRAVAGDQAADQPHQPIFIAGRVIQ